MKFEIDISPWLQDQLKRCSEIDRVAPLMLDASAPILINAVQKRLRAHSTAGATQTKTYKVADGRSRFFSWTQTGRLAESLEGQKCTRNKRGEHIKKVNFVGCEDRDSWFDVPYDLIANQIEYGNSRQPAQPFRKAAMEDCRSEIAAEMRRVYRKEMGFDE